MFLRFSFNSFERFHRRGGFDNDDRDPFLENIFPGDGASRSCESRGIAGKCRGSANTIATDKSGTGSGAIIQSSDQLGSIVVIVFTVAAVDRKAYSRPD